MTPTSHNYRQLFVGLDTRVPLLNGREVTYVNLDNAASTPPLRHVLDKVDSFMEYYSSVHRGTGFKSQLSTHLYEASREQILQYVQADPAEHVCIFGKNTTEAVNTLAARIQFSEKKNIVLVSAMEHHSDDLPWRARSKVMHIGLMPDGRLDEAHYDSLLEQYSGRIALVAVTGASNVTGYINPVHRLAEKAHQAGAYFLADCAQLAPHRRVDMRPLSDPGHLDFVTLSAHKMYAPFGTGALVGRRDIFAQGEPGMRGGGQVEIVTLDSVVWSEPPERDEAGSPNVAGAVAMAAAAAKLLEIGMDTVADHEAQLTAYALDQMETIDGVHFFGDADSCNTRQRLGVIPFNLEGVSHFLTAAILGHEYGIGVRNGCFCAHPYMLHLLGVREKAAEKVRADIIDGDRSDMPGMVRVSFGLYNTYEDIDRLIEALRNIRSGNSHGNYRQVKSTGEYLPDGWKVDFDRYFTFK